MHLLKKEQVISLDVFDEKGKKVAEEAGQRGPGSVHFLHCDTSKRDEVERVFEVGVGYSESLVKFIVMKMVGKGLNLNRKCSDIVHW
jgi:hypothetical protein